MNRASLVVLAAMTVAGCVDAPPQIGDAPPPAASPIAATPAPTPVVVATIQESGFRSEMQLWYDRYESAMVPIVAAFNAIGGSAGNPERQFCNELLAGLYAAKSRVSPPSDGDIANLLPMLYTATDEMGHACLQQNDGRVMFQAVLVHSSAGLIDKLMADRYGASGVGAQLRLPADAAERGAAFARGTSSPAAPSATIPADPKVLDARSRVTEANATWYRFAWRVQVNNPASTAVRFGLEVEFVDRDGFTIDSDTEYNLELGPGETRIFSGDDLVNYPAAERVHAVRAKIVRS